MIGTALRWIMNIVILLLLVLILLSACSLARYVLHPGEVPDILGYSPMSVLSGSMKPVLKPGDLIIVKNLDAARIKAGDVITYKTDMKDLITHRVIKVMNDNGELSFVTKGDANANEDRWSVDETNLVGALVCIIPYGGRIAGFVRSPAGILILLVLSAAILLGGYIRRMGAGSLLCQKR